MTAVLRSTVLVDAPPRSVSAVFSERRLFGGEGVLAPGAEISLLGGRSRVAELSSTDLRLVPVGGLAVAVWVHLSPTPAGVLATCSVRAPMPLRRRVLRLLSSMTSTLRVRAVALASARVVVGTAIMRGRSVLAQQRAYPASAAGLWELPGGGVEPGESDVDAVVRECREELGVKVLPGAPVGPDVALGKGKVLRIYAAELADPEDVPHPHDHQALRWLTAGQLGLVPWLPADEVLLPALRRLLTAASCPQPLQPSTCGSSAPPAPLFPG